MNSITELSNITSPYAYIRVQSMFRSSVTELHLESIRRNNAADSGSTQQSFIRYNFKTNFLENDRCYKGSALPFHGTS